MPNSNWNLETKLYRHFGIDGDLLYIGITVNTLSRQSGHMRSSVWADKIRRIEIEVHDNRWDAMIAERFAIIHEKPKYNKIHNLKNLPPRPDAGSQDKPIPAYKLLPCPDGDQWEMVDTSRYTPDAQMIHRKRGHTRFFGGRFICLLSNVIKQDEERAKKRRLKKA